MRIAILGQGGRGVKAGVVRTAENLNGGKPNGGEPERRDTERRGTEQRAVRVRAVIVVG
jgi:hypothetical protein